MRGTLLNFGEVSASEGLVGWLRRSLLTSFRAWIKREREVPWRELLLLLFNVSRNRGRNHEKRVSFEIKTTDKIYF